VRLELVRWSAVPSADQVGSRPPTVFVGSCSVQIQAYFGVPATSRNPLIATLVVLTCAFALGQSQAQAQVKPFKMTGGGDAPDGISLILGAAEPHNATGNATELGNYSGEGMFQLLNFTSELTADFSSAPYFVFTAANGDELTVTYGDVNNGAAEPGEVTLYPQSDGGFIAVFVAEFNPVPDRCTGRFAKLTGGSFIVVATSDEFYIPEGSTNTTPFTYTWEGSGSLVFGKGK
jgi:hypothetical protein